MRILITGGDQQLGGIVGAHFGRDHNVLLTGRGDKGPASSDLEFRTADLRDPEMVPSLVEDADAVLHLADFDPPAIDAGDAEQQRLEISCDSPNRFVTESWEGSQSKRPLADLPGRQTFRTSQ